MPTTWPRCSVEWSSTWRRIFQRGNRCSTPPGSCRFSSAARLLSVCSPSHRSKPFQMSGQVCLSAFSGSAGPGSIGSRQVPGSAVRKHSSQTLSPSQVCCRVARMLACEMRKSRLSSSAVRAEQPSSKFRLAHAEWRTSASSACLARDTGKLYTGAERNRSGLQPGPRLHAWCARVRTSATLSPRRPASAPPRRS